MNEGGKRSGGINQRKKGKPEEGEDKTTNKKRR